LFARKLALAQNYALAPEEFLLLDLLNRSSNLHLEVVGYASSEAVTHLGVDVVNCVSFFSQ
jgi:hypothetical protein